MINVCTATLEELETLPGVGATRAAELVALRAGRPLTCVEDLAVLRGFGPRLLERLRPVTCFVPVAACIHRCTNCGLDEPDTRVKVCKACGAGPFGWFYPEPGGGGRWGSPPAARSPARAAPRERVAASPGTSAPRALPSAPSRPAAKPAGAAPPTPAPLSHRASPTPPVAPPPAKVSTRPATPEPGASIHEKSLEELLEELKIEVASGPARPRFVPMLVLGATVITVMVALMTC
jgi:hypothetical protein